MILPAGEVLPPLVSPAAAPAATERPAGRKGGRRNAKGFPKHSERFASINAFVDGSLRGLGRAPMAVWIVLWRDERHGLSRTAISDLARRVGCSRSTVGRALASLKKLGLVTLVRPGGPLAGPNVYRVRPEGSPAGGHTKPCGYAHSLRKPVPPE